MDGAEQSAAETASLVALGNRLRALRAERGWSQADLAEAADLSVATIRKIENHYPGKRTDKTCERLSRAFGLADDYFNTYQPASLKQPGMPTSPSALDHVMMRIDEIVGRINELIIPELKSLEKEVRQLADMVYRTGSPIDVNPASHDEE